MHNVITLLNCIKYDKIYNSWNKLLKNKLKMWNNAWTDIEN